MSSKLLPQGVPAAMLALALLGACRERPRSASDTGAAPSTPATDTMARPTGMDSAGAAGKLTDPNIVALLDEANKADSSAGAIAAKKATSAAVKAFANEMMIDHHKLRSEGAKLAKRLKITPEPPAYDPLTPAAQDETSALQSTPKGPEFDRTYIEKEVSAHQAVKDLLDQAHRSTQNQQIQRLIEKATPIVQQHLDHAQKLQKQLTTSA
jgi:putative membrane protein